MSEFEEVLEEGKEYIIPEREKEWIKFCNTNKSDSLAFSAVRDIVEIMRMLKEENLTVSEIANTVDGGRYSGFSWGWVELQVCKYAPRGYEFVLGTNSVKTDPMLEKFKELHEENLKISNQTKKTKR